MNRIQLLDCTLRDGAYIVDGDFGTKTISGIIKRLQEAKVDIIECGWLKDSDHKEGTSYYNVPNDLKKYLATNKSKYSTYVAMIDYNRYDINRLPEYDGETIDAIRVVFPKNKIKEGLALVEPIRAKGYKVYLQAANTLGYTDKELLELAEAVNEKDVEALSIVDTFGAMYNADLQRILLILNNNLRKDVAIGFHSHNNQQLSFALTMSFVEMVLSISDRKCIVDSSLCGMGRGAGNAPSELVVGYLNKQHYKDYDINVVMDTIDLYMTQFLEKYKWGYSIPYMLAGTYECHVNNVAYLTQTHRTKSKDMRIVFEMLDAEKRREYDYDNLEKVYSEYQNRNVNDIDVKDELKRIFAGKEIIAVLPGKSAIAQKKEADKYISERDSIVVGINAIVDGYDYDYLFFSNSVKYELAKESYREEFDRAVKIITSNIKEDGNDKKMIVNYNDLLKKKWKYYDNSAIMFLRLMSEIHTDNIAFVGFDGYLEEDHKYADEILEPNLSREEIGVLQSEIEDMLKDYIKINTEKIEIKFITKSVFEKLI